MRLDAKRRYVFHDMKINYFKKKLLEDFGILYDKKKEKSKMAKNRSAYKVHYEFTNGRILCHPTCNINDGTKMSKDVMKVTCGKCLQKYNSGKI